jgi:hypothetical protein
MVKNTIAATHVYGNKVWIEGDMNGSKHVMVQSEVPALGPACYCTFYYVYPYTDNARIRLEAERVAKSLGATDPVEYRDMRSNAQADAPPSGGSGRAQSWAAQARTTKDNQ